jgi:glucose-1-phosphate cytidylyltransferase
MKAVVLAGGLGTRMQELTQVVPKPMIEVGGKPALWHIMKIFSSFGVSHFDVALGYKGDIIKDFFVNYSRMQNSIRVNLENSQVEELDNNHEDWVVELIETGALTQTGGRIARMREFIGGKRFFLTYGDGMSDVDLSALLEHHLSHGRLATVTAVRPPSKFGALGLSDDGNVTQFTEKPNAGETWISGGFFVFEPEIFDYLSTDEDCILERAPLEKVAMDGQLSAYKHDGFWQCMDTARDVSYLNDLWESNEAPWKVWE